MEIKKNILFKLDALLIRVQKLLGINRIKHISETMKKKELIGLVLLMSLPDM